LESIILTEAYQFVLLALVWVFLLLYGLWPSEPLAARLPSPKPLLPLRKRSTEPTPFMGLTHKPLCEACEQGVALRREPPCGPPPPIVSTRGRQRQVDTSHHFCPAPDCRYRGWLGLGNIRANGHPSSGPRRQLYCNRCGGYFLETHGTILHGKQGPPEKLV
jgi:hypothetical protein